jgi:hypothetical protein
VVKSSGEVYGSSNRDPAMFTEDMGPRRVPRTGYGKDVLEIEGYVRGFARRRPEVSVTVLRNAPLLSPTTRPEEMFKLVEKHKVTHIKVVPALLIRLINEPMIGKYHLSTIKIIQSGGQRMQPEVRLKTHQLIPSCTHRPKGVVESRDHGPDDMLIHMATDLPPLAAGRNCHCKEDKE